MDLSELLQECGRGGEAEQPGTDDSGKYKGWMWVISLCNVTFLCFLMNLSLKLWCFSSPEVAKRVALGQRSKLSCLTLYDWVLDVFKKWEERTCLETW